MMMTSCIYSYDIKSQLINDHMRVSFLVCSVNEENKINQIEDHVGNVTTKSG